MLTHRAHNRYRSQPLYLIRYNCEFDLSFVAVEKTVCGHSLARFATELNMRTSQIIVAKEKVGRGGDFCPNGYPSCGGAAASFMQATRQTSTALMTTSDAGLAAAASAAAYQPCSPKKHST